MSMVHVCGYLDYRTRVCLDTACADEVIACADEVIVGDKLTF